MNLDVWLLYVAAIFVVIAIPGPLSLLMISNVINHGLRKSWPAIAGGVSASLILLVISALGLGALIVSSPLLFNVAKYGGAAYLAYLGLKTVLIPVQKPAETGKAAQVLFEPKFGLLFNRAFLLGISNPKDILFFIAFLPQFIDPAKSIYVQLGVMVATWIAVDVACKLSYGLSAKVVNPFLRSYTGKKLFNAVTGVFFIGTACLAAFLHA
ncbi:LysE family translocator [Crenobacter cavernae]|uniref:LysE family translocator n=1 Tax=Crenobacter cavernae TaxID=2290923 RepID=A0A345Y3G9_9NEIS|nr:LysE family translocator [Crenobacter cavernae]AXK38471.1 LysE family translocator [Crenobacter cavernae]